MDFGDLLLVFAPILGAPLVGLSPALLPSRLPLAIRWGFALLLLAGSACLTYMTVNAPHPYLLLMLVPFWFGWVVGALLLVRRRRPSPAKPSTIN
jgi:hypothetical protein